MNKNVHLQEICRNSLHSCHRRLTTNESTKNGWQEWCNRPMVPATKIVLTFFKIVKAIFKYAKAKYKFAKAYRAKHQEENEIVEEEFSFLLQQFRQETIYETGCKESKSGCSTRATTYTLNHNELSHGGRSVRSFRKFCGLCQFKSKNQ